MKFDQFNESADILHAQAAVGGVFKWRSHSLRSNCRVTNQPDWGDVYIHIAGHRTVSPESLLQYIVSMRKENHFHEEICECIYKRLWDMLTPQELMVSCLYTRRGGIDINPEDIESVNILKGPAAAALYGVRAGAGAIIITTKKGKKGVKSFTVDVSSSVEMSQVNKLPNLQNKYSQGRGATATGGGRLAYDSVAKRYYSIAEGKYEPGITPQSWGA
jgi:TonB-dependent SusC/RagA subfamily outer membrane receptor